MTKRTMTKRTITTPILKNLALGGLLLGLGACAPTSWTDPQPGRAAAPPPPEKLSDRSPGRSPGNSADRSSARAGPVVVGEGGSGRRAQTSPDANPAPPRSSDPQPPPRRRGSSSPPPVAAPMPVPSPLPQAPSSDAMTDRFKRDLMSPEVDRMRANDAMGTLNPLQQRELFDKQRDLGRIGGPLGN